MRITSSSRKLAASYVTFLESFYSNFWLLLSERNARKEQLLLEINYSSHLTEEEIGCLVREHFARETSLLRIQRISLHVTDFEWIAKIGSGAFATVYLVRRCNHDQYLALKHIPKSSLSIDSVVRVRTERAILAGSYSRWITQLVYAFQTEDSLFLAMEFVPGGSFSTLLDELGMLSEDVSMFYFAEMVFSVQQLHAQGFIHRDLKPENFLINKDGHLKLSDFGLSKTITSQTNSDQNNVSTDSSSIDSASLLTFSVVGTPNYMAPELIQSHINLSNAKPIDPSQLGKSLDSWSLGCILYELLTGEPPMQTDGLDIERPPEISDITWDLLCKLLDLNPRTRLSIDNILEHPFFNGLHVDKLETVSPPFIPEHYLQEETDLTYFPGAVELNGNIPEEVLGIHHSPSPKSPATQRQRSSILPPTPVFETPNHTFLSPSASPLVDKLCLEDLEIGPVPRTTVRPRPKVTNPSRNALSSPRKQVQALDLSHSSPLASPIKEFDSVKINRSRSLSEPGAHHLAGFTFVGHNVR
ncbi:hypothetical protein P9112_003990 [Eukaryota sp. TZLM1-RC]